MAKQKQNRTKKAESTPALEGKRFWRSKIFIKGIGTVEGEVKDSDFKAFVASIPSDVEVDFNRWCLTESEMKAKKQSTREKNRLAKS